MKIFRVGSRQFRGSLRELLRELWVSYWSSRERPFREWNFVFREWNFKFRELLREYPGTLRELREWPFHSESFFPEIGVVPRLLTHTAWIVFHTLDFLHSFPHPPRTTIPSNPARSTNKHTLLCSCEPDREEVQGFFDSARTTFLKIFRTRKMNLPLLRKNPAEYGAAPRSHQQLSHRVARHLSRPKFRCDTSRHRGGEVRRQNFRGCSATPVLHLQNAIKSRKWAATRAARHV